MEIHYLSVVQIAADEHATILNQLAEQLGYGENSLSIQLQDQHGAIYWACHSWWTKEKYLLFKGSLRLSIQDPLVKRAFFSLHEFVIDTENMQQAQIDAVPSLNMGDALEFLGLHYYQDDESNQTP